MLFDELAELIFHSLGVRKTTLSTYRSMYRCHISPIVGGLETENIQRNHVISIVNSLPPQTAQMTLAVFKTLFREGIALGVVDKTPVHGIRSPKVIVPARKFLLWEDLSAIDFGKYDRQIKFLALHGLRWGEAVALTEADIRNGKIYINKSIHGSTKSSAGIRVVPLIGDFTPLPKHPRTLRRPLKLFGVTIHSLRHTYAYILKQQGVHVTTAQRLLGHSDPKVTLAIYTRVLDKEIDEVGVMLNNMEKMTTHRK
jgi:integrase